MSVSTSKPTPGNGDLDGPPLTERDFDVFSQLIRQRTGISLAAPKRELLRTRLRKRLRALGLASFSDYYRLITGPAVTEAEMQAFINCVTTNKTDFQREPHHFEFLAQRAFPEIVERSKTSGQRKLRIWSAACSTGQEPYSIAISIREFFDRLPGWDARILASDIDSGCLADAARGQYAEELIDCYPLDIKRRYFLRGTDRSAGRVAARPNLRELITFRRINFADTQWPIQAKFDIIFCRNAMIYFDREFQEQLLRKFMQYLAPQGYLILGHSENVSWMSDLEPLGKTVYRMRQGAATAGRPMQPVRTAPIRRPVPSRPATPEVASPVPAENKTTAKRSRHAIVAGQVYATNQPIEITTLLGSCIAACLYDPAAKVGGMNHFLLPEGTGAANDAACYGINAMELLINELMQLGGDRGRMVARLYGGASVMAGHLQSSRVGEKNIAFVRKYLTTEGIPILEQKVGGTRALKVAMHADSGDVSATELDEPVAVNLSQKERVVAAAATEAARTRDKDQITLF